MTKLSGMMIGNFMRNIMIDLETMGNGSNAAIVSIGAVLFDPFTYELALSFIKLSVLIVVLIMVS